MYRYATERGSPGTRLRGDGVRRPPAVTGSEVRLTIRYDAVRSAVNAP